MEEYITPKEAKEMIDTLIPLSNAQVITFKEYAQIMVICASALKRLEREV